MLFHSTTVLLQNNALPDAIAQQVPLHRIAFTQTSLHGGIFTQTLFHRDTFADTHAHKRFSVFEEISAYFFCTQELSANSETHRRKQRCFRTHCVMVELEFTSVFDNLYAFGARVGVWQM